MMMTEASSFVLHTTTHDWPERLRVTGIAEKLTIAWKDCEDNGTKVILNSQLLYHWFAVILQIHYMYV